MQKNTISLQLAGKRFQVPCAESDAPDLLQAAEAVNNALKSASRQQIPMETRLLMLSLNLSYELLQSDRFNKQLESDISQALRHVQRLMEEEKGVKEDKECEPEEPITEESE
jgi:cell division protein ZapA (FtsZ GTPase activity inhibitor)